MMATKSYNPNVVAGNSTIKMAESIEERFDKVLARSPIVHFYFMQERQRAISRQQALMASVVALDKQADFLLQNSVVRGLITTIPDMKIISPLPNHATVIALIAAMRRSGPADSRLAIAADIIEEDIDRFLDAIMEALNQ